MEICWLALRPSKGVGVDFSPEMIQRARVLHPDITFVEADCHNLQILEGPFDAIILSDLVNDIWDVQEVFAQLSRLCHERTRVIMNSLQAGYGSCRSSLGKTRFGQKRKMHQNWLTIDDISEILNLADLEVIRTWHEILWPFIFLSLPSCATRFLPSCGLSSFSPCPTSYGPSPDSKCPEAPLVSVIVAARNEAGNIAEIFRRTPEIGAGTEIVFVEGHSQDDTYSVIEKEIVKHPERRSQLHRQTGKGKAMLCGLDSPRQKAIY